MSNRNDNITFQENTINKKGLLTGSQEYICKIDAAKTGIEITSVKADYFDQYVYNAKGKLIRYLQKPGDLEVKYRYNKYGKVKWSKKGVYPMRIDQGVETEVYKYNSQQELIQIIDKDDIGDPGILNRFDFTFKYNEQGVLIQQLKIQQTEDYGDEETNFTYNDSGQLVETVKFYGEDPPHRRKVYSYSGPNLIESKKSILIPYSDDVIFTHAISYNAQGFVKSITVEDELRSFDYNISTEDITPESILGKIMRVKGE